MKTICYIYIIFDVKRPGHRNPIYILGLLCLYIYLSFVAPFVTLVQIFGACVISHGIWMGFYYWYICRVFNMIEKVTSACKNLLHDLIMYLIYILHILKQRQSRKPLLFIWYAKRNNNAAKTLYFNLCLIVDLLDIIYECFTFHIFLICVSESVRSDPFLLHSTMFIFFHYWLKYSKIAFICSFRMAQIEFILDLKKILPYLLLASMPLTLEFNYFTYM